jgi:hypothetical protein
VCIAAAAQAWCRLWPFGLVLFVHPVTFTLLTDLLLFRVGGSTSCATAASSRSQLFSPATI